MRISPLRVLRLAPVLDFGGVESRFVMQRREWSTEDIHVDYACFWKDGDAADKIRATGQRVYVLNQNPSIRNAKATYALWRFLRAKQYDVVHASIGEANFHAMLCARLGPWRTIIEEAGIPQRTLRNRLIHAGLYTLPDRIVCVSQAGADNIVQNEWAPRRKIQVIHNAIDAVHFGALQNRQPNRTLFRAVGRLTPVKNFDGLIRAFHIAAQNQPNIHLEIIGEGAERPVLEALIQTLNLQAHVTLLGFRDDVARLHQTTGWLLMPSHREGFGLVAAEAMAAGVPVLASGAGGLREVLGDLAHDWTVPAEDSAAWGARIVQLAQMDDATYQNVSAKFRAQAERFRPQQYRMELERLYRNV